MSVETEWDVERGVAIRRVLGDLTVQDAVEAMKSSYSHPNFVGGMNSLWDLRQGSLAGLSTFDVREIIWFADATVETRGRGYRTALVAPTDADFGTSRLLKTLGSHLPGNIRIFRGYDEALAWLSEPEPRE